MYFVVRDGGEFPRALVRVDRGVEQEFTREGEWAGSDVLSRPDPQWAVTEVYSGEFYRHVHRIVRDRRERAGHGCVAVFSTHVGVDELHNATAVMRRRDGAEEWLDETGVWQAGTRDLGERIWLPISEEELDRVKWTVVRPAWFVLHDGSDHPYAVVRKIPSAEEAFTRRLRWEPSDLLGREDLRVEELAHPLDADRAVEAVEFGVRAERQRARGGPEYFTLRDRFYSREVFGVVRRTGTTEEVHAGRAGWVPSAVVGQIERGEVLPYEHLPVSWEEAEAVIAGRSGRRCFLVRDRPDDPLWPFAVVRVDGEREVAFTRDLVWEPSTLLARVARQQGLWVEELPPYSSGAAEAFRLASRVRHERRRTEWAHDEHWYFAVFTDWEAALDLAKAHRLHRTRAGWSTSGRNYDNGEWTYSGWELEDSDRGKSDDVYLPISPEEARRLMTMLESR
ncbi:hypothetical protein SAMN05216188_116131 [Lentzea xinjiangensis]|uniref:Uncharacterized protein n=1 Tax=Lentzea xinjiangensis TaxID=402600 RepID=A0A1H9SKJ7_9PSEU|nr:hypothetical protein [Lentzea xinjiangensis]SER85540.1 hypothetical protein SAMN05216188_116131 [Lentzea xinjiangensis]